MKKLVALLALPLVLASCGGGGPDAGACPFPGNCPSASGGSAPGGTVSGFTRTGTGASVLTVPAGVDLVRIQGTTDSVAENFAVRSNGRLIVNAVIGTSQSPRAHDGTYDVQAGGTLEIFQANGVSWTVSSVASPPASSGQFTRQGSGATVFELPARSARYLIRATNAGVAANFAVLVDGRLVVNALVGTTYTPPSFDGIYALNGGRVEITTTSAGVNWSFTEQP